MELLKKNIHMDRIARSAVTQVTLEDDFNVPDQKPDVNGLTLEKGTVLIDEVKPGTDHVNVRGRLVFQALYRTEEGGCGLACLEGKVPFEEKLNLQGAANTDHVTVEGEVEDLSISLINSRKLNLQSVLTLNAWVEELYDEEAPIGIYGEEAVEYRKTPVELTQMAISKNDIFRIREEIGLPGNYPNVFQILWSSVTLGGVEFRALSEKLQLQGELNVFLLYEGEGEDHPIRTFEYTLPFGGMLECHGCREGMIPEIRCELSPQEPGQGCLSVKPDPDGEERNLCLDLTLNICMKLYEEENLEILEDLYGVASQVETAVRSASLRRLLSRVNGKTQVRDRIRAAGGDGVLQLLHSEGQVAVEDQQIVENGIRLSGCLQLQILYIAGNDEAPYANVKGQVPFQYTLEVPGIAPTDVSQVRPCLEQLQVSMLDGEEMEVKAILGFSTTVFSNVSADLIQSVQARPLDGAVLGALPGMAVYLVKSGDNLWNIGKKYYLPVDAIRTMNELQTDDLFPGQKLLLIKGQ